MDSKYIVLDDDRGPLQMIIFPPSIIHADVAKKFATSNIKIKSAGFIRRKSSYEDGMFCYGNSISLNVSSNPDIDNILLKRLFCSDN